jgi:hypothetical protein
MDHGSLLAPDAAKHGRYEGLSVMIVGPRMSRP